MRRVPTLLSALAAACSVAPSGGPPSGACSTTPARPKGLIVAGSGTNLALARELGRAFSATKKNAHVHVPGSIGTAGAVQALADGAIDLGLASRRLTEEESEGLRTVPLARVPLAVVVHERTPVFKMTSATLLALLQGERTAWPDGTPALVLLREPGDSGNRLLRAKLPGIGPALDAALAAGRWPVCTTDQEVRDALLTLEGAVGFLDSGTIAVEGLPLRPLPLNGHAPSEGRRYPLLKPLSLLVPETPTALATAFVLWVTSPAAVESFYKGGYVPPSARGAP